MRQWWLDHLMMSCNGKGHSSFARVKFQVAFDRRKSCGLSSRNSVISRFWVKWQFAS